MGTLAGRAATILLAFGTGLVIVWLSLPRLVGGLYVAPYGDMMESLSAGQTVKAASLAHAVRSHVAALQWFDSSETWARLGSLRFMLAREEGYDTPAGKDYLNAAFKAQKTALALQPAQPFVWLQMAQAAMLLGSPPAEISPLLTMAIATGPYDPKLVLKQVDLALYIWPSLTDSARSLASRQVVLAARYYPDRLAVVTLRHGSLALVRQALAGEPEVRAKFDKMFLKAGKRLLNPPPPPLPAKKN